MTKLLFSNTVMRNEFKRNLDIFKKGKAHRDPSEAYEEGIHDGAVSAAVTIANMLADRGIISKNESRIIVGMCENETK